MTRDEPAVPEIVPQTEVLAAAVPEFVVPELVDAQQAGTQRAQVPDSLTTATPPIRFVDEGYSWLAANLWLCGSLAILVLATVMTVGPERQVYLPGLSVPVPETCTLRARFAIDCPGCGMTRSFIHIAHGRILDALRLNPASILVFLFIAAQIPAAAARFLLGRSSRMAIAWTRFNELALIALPSITFLQWIIRMSTGVYT